MLNLSSSLSSVLDGNILIFLRRCGAIADRLGLSCWAVGGVVRDVLLGVASRDVDVTVVGDPELLATAYCEQWGGDIVKRSRFGTLTMRLPDIADVDMVRARAERYAYPGALPDVQAGTLNDDLRRRDFTVNSLACSLNANSWGTLVDVGWGVQDIENGVLRVWHDNSFIDDPTRILRALKLAVRYDWQIEKHTRELLLEAVRGEALNGISWARWGREILLMLSEMRAPECLLSLNEYGISRMIWRSAGYSGSDSALQEMECRATQQLRAIADERGADVAVKQSLTCGANSREVIVLRAWLSVLPTEIANNILLKASFPRRLRKQFFSC